MAEPQQAAPPVVRMMAGNVHPGSSGRRQQVGSAIREQGRDAMRSAERARSRSGKRATTGAARHTPAKQSQRQREERQRRRAGWESDAAMSGEHGELQRQYEATQYAELVHRHLQQRRDGTRTDAEVQPRDGHEWAIAANGAPWCRTAGRLAHGCGVCNGTRRGRGGPSGAATSSASAGLGGISAGASGGGSGARGAGGDDSAADAEADRGPTKLDFGGCDEEEAATAPTAAMATGETTAMEDGGEEGAHGLEPDCRRRRRRRRQSGR